MRGNGLVKLVLALAVVAAMGAVLMVALKDAKRRATLTHCRNNLRKIGELAIKYQDLDGPRWDSLCADFESTFGRPCDFSSDGRGFLQRIKILGFARKKKDGADADKVVMTFNLEPMNMFDCPANGPNGAALHTIESIDYRGPEHTKLTRYEKTYQVEPFASDRPGNHEGGGVNVLYMNLAVTDSLKQWWVGKVHDSAAEPEHGARADKHTRD